jgi:hypothetical protein
MATPKSSATRVIVISETDGVENQRIEFVEGSSTPPELFYKHFAISGAVLGAITKVMQDMATEATENPDSPPWEQGRSNKNAR